MAFLVNLLAFPFFLGLLPYVAKDVFGVGQAGLGWLAGAFWSGALIGSVVVGARQLSGCAPRASCCGTARCGSSAILVFGQTTSLAFGLVLLFAIGFVQSFCLTPLAAVMLRSSDEAMRGRVMGVRMLAIWGLPLGLLAAGPLIAALRLRGDHVLYAGLGAGGDAGDRIPVAAGVMESLGRSQRGLRRLKGKGHVACIPQGCMSFPLTFSRRLISC